MNSSNQKNSSGHDPKVYDLDSIDGHEFEKVLKVFFSRLSYNVKITQKTADKGKDLILSQNSQKIIVESKNHKNSISRPDVQKLHSAVSTTDNAKRGIVVNPGGFTQPAINHAKDITQNSEVDIELWNYGKLQEKGNSVNLYFELEDKETHLYFKIPWSSEDDLKSFLKDNYISSLDSHPRDIVQETRFKRSGRSYIPAYVIEYNVSKHFSSSTYDLYHANDSGKYIFPLSEKDLKTELERFLSETRLTRYKDSELDDTPIAAYFDSTPSKYKQEVKKQVARSLSKTVNYTGRNNQSYSKKCKVKTKDVRTSVKQTLIAKNDFSFSFGPSNYQISFLDNENNWHDLPKTKGFKYGKDALLQGGKVCNDCGILAPKHKTNSGIQCENCERTLCPEHYWNWPMGWFNHSPRFCSECYQSKDPKTDKLTDTDGYLNKPFLSALISLLPGLFFLIGKRNKETASLISLTLITEASIAYNNTIADFIGPEFHPEFLGLELLALPVGLSVLTSVHWSQRLKKYNQTKDFLEQYEPAWEGSKTAEDESNNRKSTLVDRGINFDVLSRWIDKKESPLNLADIQSQIENISISKKWHFEEISLDEKSQYPEKSETDEGPSQEESTHKTERASVNSQTDVTEEEKFSANSDASDKSKKKSEVIEPEISLPKATEIIKRNDELTSLLQDKLRSIRKNEGLSQTELANKLGESQVFISNCESGRRQIDPIEFWAICEACDRNWVKVVNEVIDEFNKNVS